LAGLNVVFRCCSFAHLEQNSQNFPSTPLVLDSAQFSTGIEPSPLFNKDMDRHSRRFAINKHSIFVSGTISSESKRTFLMFLGRLCVSATLLAQQSMEPKNSNQVKMHTIIKNFPNEEDLP